MNDDEKRAKELMDELINLTEQGAKAGYILAPQLDVMREQAEKRGAERMLEVFRTKVTETGLFFIQKDDERREPEASLYLDDVWAEYERLKEPAK